MAVGEEEEVVVDGVDGEEEMTILLHHIQGPEANHLAVKIPGVLASGQALGLGLEPDI